MPVVPTWIPLLGPLQRSWGFAHLSQSHLLFAPLGHEHTMILPALLLYLLFPLFKLSTIFRTTFSNCQGVIPQEILQKILLLFASPHY